MTMITQARLRELYMYRADGCLVSYRFKKPVVGKLTADGYREICCIVHGKKVYIRTHRAVWLWHHGNLPPKLDHINRDRLDNRIENLRPCTDSQNQWNQGLSKTSTTGTKVLPLLSLVEFSVQTSKLTGSQSTLEFHMTQLRQRKCTIGQHASYLVSLLALTFLSGCGSLPPDEPLCVEITMTRGYCVKTMSGDTFTVDDMNLLEGKTWWDMRPTMIQMPASTWAKFKIWINKICKNNSQCDSAVANWQRTVNTIDAATQ